MNLLISAQRGIAIVLLGFIYRDRDITAMVLLLNPTKSRPSSSPLKFKYRHGNLRNCGVDRSFQPKDIWTSLTLHDHHWIGRHEIFVKKNRWLLHKASIFLEKAIISGVFFGWGEGCRFPRSSGKNTCMLTFLMGMRIGWILAYFVLFFSLRLLCLGIYWSHGSDMVMQAPFGAWYIAR